MKNTISDLNNYLFEQLERLNDDSLTEEELDKTIRKSEAIVKVSEKIIQNGELAFKTMRHMDEYGYRDHRGQLSRPVPTMLDTSKEKI